MISLRDVTEDDRDRLRFWRNLPEVRKWMYSDHEISEAEHDEWFLRMKLEQTSRYWVIALDQMPVGLVNLANINFKNSVAAWAFYLADPAVRGRGVGSVVEYLTIEYSFRTLGLHRLSCEVLAGNEQVIAMHESFGFRREGLFREAVLKQGVRHDVVAMALLKDEWEAISGSVSGRLRAKGLIDG